MPAVVSGLLPTVGWVAFAWVLGGVISLIGALCFAELTTTYPDFGGDYGYLKRAYHRRVGFAFSWAAFWIIRPGNIGTMAMIFGEFAVQILPGDSVFAYAVASVVAMSVLNLLGVQFGKLTQNTLTTAKVIGILLVVGSAFFVWSDSLSDSITTDPAAELSVTESESQATTEEQGENDTPSIWSSFWLSMVFVMFTYGGWNDIAFVAREVQEPEKNLLRSLVLGTVGVLLIYLMVNFGLIYSLSFEQMQAIGSEWGNPTLFLVKDRLGDLGQHLFAILVCVSCLGAINAMVFTSPRIYWATAMDYPGLQWLTGQSGSGSKQVSHGWWRALILQMLVTVLFLVVFNATQGIEKMTAATAPYFWLFLATTVASLAVSRWRFRGEFDGYRVPLYPLTPLIFIGACIFMAYQAWSYLLDQDLLLVACCIGGWVSLGIALSFLMEPNNEKEQS